MSVRPGAPSVRSLFGRITRRYDLLNSVLSFGIHHLWRTRMAEALVPGPTGRVLDLAAGTLDSSLAIQNALPRAQVFAFDFCLPMLMAGQQKLQSRDPVHLAAADALQLPLPSACVDAITMAFGIRNIKPRTQAFAEMARVLVPGGRACILELGTGQNTVWGGCYNLYLNHVLPFLGGLISGDSAAYAYLSDSVKMFPTPDIVEEEMRDSGFSAVYHIPLTSGIAHLYVGVTKEPA